uniref:Uncharacterized protein n=1 Tax=Panagrolaimus sp. JU765 TaxID=591449 RepID=A0AC34Q443_9BILA
MPLITDNNNYIIEWNFPKIDGRNWKETNSKLLNIPGIVETGLFLDVADGVYFAHENGRIEVIKKNKY